MTDVTEAPGGSNPVVASGDTDGSDETQNVPPERASSKDSVAYETYHRTVSQKKKLQEENERLKAEAASRAESELKEQNKWKELAELKESEANVARASEESLRKQITDEVIYTSLSEALPGGLDKKFRRLVEPHVFGDGGVVVNPETGMPEESSIQLVAKNILETYPNVFVATTVAGQPSAAPSSSAPKKGDLSLAAWKALPREEMKAARDQGRINFDLK